MRGTHLGKLITVRGIVTRVSEVKPMLQVNAYTCDSCGSEIFQDVEQRKLIPLTECVSQACVDNQSKGKLHMQTRASKFTPFQECKIQEMVSAVTSITPRAPADIHKPARRIKSRSGTFLAR